MSCRKPDLLSSRSRSKWGLTSRKHDCFDYIFRTSDPFARKFSLVVHCHKPQGLVKRLDCCTQSQGQSQGSKVQGADIIWTNEPFVTKLGNAHKLECHFERIGLLSANLWWVMMMHYRVCVCVCAFVRAFVSAGACVPTCARARVCVYVRVCAHVSARVWIRGCECDGECEWKRKWVTATCKSGHLSCKFFFFFLFFFISFSLIRCL